MKKLTAKEEAVSFLWKMPSCFSRKYRCFYVKVVPEKEKL